MSSFFDKMKEGAAKAADKAQQALEIQRLNFQISNARKEIEKIKIQIGDVALQGYKRASLTEAEGEIAELCKLIIRQESIIASIEQKIHEVKSGYPPMG